MKCAFLHGFAGDPAVWDEVIASWRAPLVPDAVALRGHGAGSVLPTWDDNVDAIGDAIAGADVVVGYSLGARVALGLIAAGQCERAILIGVNPGLTDDAERVARRASDAEWAKRLRTQGIAAFADAWQAQPLFASQARFATRRAVRRARRLEHDPEELARSLEVMGLAEMPDYREALARHADRITLVVGADDAKYVAIARQLPVRLATIAGSGHDPTLEQPTALAIALEDLIKRWIR